MIDVVRVLIPAGTLVSGYDVQCFWYPSSRNKKVGRKIGKQGACPTQKGESRAK